jgi:hypothetical protein
VQGRFSFLIDNFIAAFRLPPVPATVRRIQRWQSNPMLNGPIEVSAMSKTDAEQHNRPGSRTNTPQHLVGGYGGKDEMQHIKREGFPTGEGTAARNDVADPHPAEEERPYEAQRPGSVQGGRSIRLSEASER